MQSNCSIIAARETNVLYVAVTQNNENSQMSERSIARILRKRLLFASSGFYEQIPISRIIVSLLTNFSFVTNNTRAEYYCRTGFKRLILINLQAYIKGAYF